MNPASKRLAWLSSMLALSGIVFAESGDDYQSIVRRNAFRLISPSIDSSAVKRPTRAAALRLTGIVTIPRPQAFLVLLPPNSAQPRFLMLAEGESTEMIEVIAISADKAEVLLRNGGNETLVRFDKRASNSSFDGTEFSQPEPGFQRPTDPSLISYSARHQGQPGWGIGQRRPQPSH